MGSNFFNYFMKSKLGGDRWATLPIGENPKRKLLQPFFQILFRRLWGIPGILWLILWPILLDFLILPCWPMLGQFWSWLRFFSWSDGHCRQSGVGLAPQHARGFCRVDRDSMGCSAWILGLTDQVGVGTGATGSFDLVHLCHVTSYRAVRLPPVSSSFLSFSPCSLVSHWPIGRFIWAAKRVSEMWPTHFQRHHGRARHFFNKVLFVCRENSHEMSLSNGELSAAGKPSPWPLLSPFANRNENRNSTIQSQNRFSGRLSLAFG